MPETTDRPNNIEAFDPSRKKTIPVDLDAPFFQKRRAEYPACNHRVGGVILDMDTRKVECRCGAEMDAFDALLFYADAEQRLQSTRRAIEEHNRKEAEKKARKPFAKRVTSLARRATPRGRHLGYDVRLECGHRAFWDKRKTPRTMTCVECFRASRLKEQGVAVMAAK